MARGAKNVLARTAACLPVNWWHALAGRPPILPYYHMVSDESLPHVRPLYRYKNISQFKQDLDFLLAHFQPVSLQDLLDGLHGKTVLPPRSFLLSFDDGFREMAEVVAPILKAKGAPAVFFLNSAFVDNRALCFQQKIALLVDRLEKQPATGVMEKVRERLRANNISGAEIIPALKSVRYTNRAVLDEVAAFCNVPFDNFLKQQKPYLTSEQIGGLLRDGFAIGGHSVDHPFYDDLTLTEQLRQTSESVNFLQEKFAVKYRAFAFPHSDRGVSQTFFQRCFTDGGLQISFGTGGLLRDSRPGHLQRFSLEKACDHSRQVLIWQLARRCCLKPVGSVAG